MPRGDVSGFVQTGAQSVYVERTKAPVVHVVFAGPDDFHRTPCRFGHERGVDDEFHVTVPATSETPAHQHAVELDVRFGDRKRLCDGRDSSSLALRAAPDLG